MPKILPVSAVFYSWSSGKLTVLVVVSVVGKGNLPPQTTTTGLVVPVGVGLRRPDTLRQRKPAGLIRRRVGEVHLGSGHGSHAPEPLIIISQGCRDVGRHVVLVRTDLPLHTGDDLLVVRRVAGVEPVVDQGLPHGWEEMSARHELSRTRGTSTGGWAMISS